MKTFTILSFLTLFLCSCGKGKDVDYGYETKFVWENKSNHAIKLLPRGYSGTIFIDVNSKHIESKVYMGGEHHGGRLPVVEPFGDCRMMTVSFNDTLNIAYCRNYGYYEDSAVQDSMCAIIDSLYIVESPFNPLRVENYAGEELSRGKKGGGTYQYTYTFTNKDFEAALKRRDSL